MCMSLVSKTFKNPTNNIVVGWKSFESGDSVLRSVYQHKVYAAGRWYKAGSKNKINRGPKYELGFHAFLSKEEAISYSGVGEEVRQVILRQVVAYGKHRNLHSVVAREMMILPLE